MDYLEQFTQKHLAGFFLDEATRLPIAGIPVYGEIAVLGTEHREPVRINLRLAHNDILAPERTRLIVEAVLSEWFNADAWDALPFEEQEAILEKMSRELVETPDFFRETPEVQTEMIRRVLERVLDGLPNQERQYKVLRAIPLGVLSTDHAGYISFDLNRAKPYLTDWERAAPYFFVGENATKPVAVLPQGRVTPDMVAGRFLVGGIGPYNAPMSHDHPGPSMQNPDLLDWSLSPASFALPAHALVGDDGCERLYPSDVATHDFVLRQVQRVAGNQVGEGNYATGYVDEYEHTWYPLGHSLGKILHSIGLAPGESVKLATIDWSWATSQQRNEVTTFSEELLHELHRDRLITESVKAGLEEWQRGATFMGGVADSVGGAGSIGMFGVAGGHAQSMGGSYSTSSGSRDLAAETAQRVTDHVSQATASLRDLRSTVVVQARQEEKQSIQTRTFTNYNHAHTLTILHYEILQHYRVVTRWVRRRHAVLIPKPARAWTHDTALLYRPILEPAMFDARAKAGFDAYEKLQVIAQDDITHPKVKPAAIVQQRDYQFTSFLFTVEVGEEETTNGVHIELRKTDGNLVALRLDGDTNINKDELFNNDGTYPIPLTPATPVKWGELVSIDMYVSGDDNLDVHQVGVVGMGTFGTVILRDYGGPTLSFIDANKRQSMTIKPPGPDVPVPPAPLEGRQRLTPEENGAIERLIKHLAGHTHYYERLLNLSRTRDDVAAAFEGINWDAGSKLIDHIDPTPLETLGTTVAYARSDMDEEPIGPDPKRRMAERLVTLPTHGVFAEGKLGHCSIAEEIDNTRFWKWEEHPLPIHAPDINPVTPVTPTPQPLQVTPTPFPTSVVNIVNPPEAPAPTGLGAALQAITTPNIFRDMSGREEVAELLQKLSDNTIKIADAANRAQEIRNKYGADLNKNASDLEGKRIEAAAQVLGKAIDSDAQKAAAARKAEADATRAEADAANAKAESAKNVPPAYRPPIYEAAAQQAAGNAVKKKSVVFRAVGFDGQVLAGPFEFYLRDVDKHADVVKETVPAYYDTQVEFSSTKPKINASATRKGTVPIQIMGDTYQLKEIKVINPGSTHAVGAAHSVIDVILKQDPRDVSFKATSTDNAVNELMNKWGGEVGIDKVAATKIIASYEEKRSIVHGNNQETAYTLKLPSEVYSLTIMSK